MKIAFLLSLIFSTACFSNINDKRERELLLDNERDQDLKLQEVYTFPEIYKYDSKLLKDLDSDSGLFSDTYFTRYDSGKISASYAHSINVDAFTEIQSFDLSYSRSFKNSWRDFWWNIQYKYTSAQIEAVDDNLKSDDNDLQTFSAFGAGLSHRFQTVGYFFNTDRMFEFVSIYLNYVLHRDNFAEENYGGFGYNADYSFSFRSSKGFFYGGKITYNWALVEKPQENNENLSSRSRVFGWTTIGFEMGYIF